MWWAAAHLRPKHCKSFVGADARHWPVDGPCHIYFQVPQVRYWRPLRGDSPRGGEMSRSDRGDGALFALSPKVTEGVVPRHKPDARGVVPHAGPKNQPNNGHVHPKKFISQ